MKVDKMNDIDNAKTVLAANLKKYTRMDEAEIREIVKTIPITVYAKRTVLLRQGFKPKHSYYLVNGCIRQYACAEDGNETTVNFLPKRSPINMFSFLDDDGSSLYSLACLEDCVVVECSDIEKQGISDDSPDIRNMKRLFFERQFSELQMNLTEFKLKTPEERFAAFVKSRPELLDRIPQIYLASYLGITPESFSRFKKRIRP